MKPGHAWLTDRLRHNGQEVLAGRAPTRVLYASFMAGESAARVSDWFKVTVENVEDAIRIEWALRRRHRWAVRWAATARREALLRRIKRNLAKATKKKASR